MTEFQSSAVGEALYAAFPVPLHSELPSVIELLSESVLASHISPHVWTVQVESHIVRIPERIYTVPPSKPRLASLTATQRTAIECWFTRHHDGYVRQRSVEAVVAAEEDWVIPYVLRLVGEYVVEILEVIEARLSDLLDRNRTLRQHYITFVRSNPAFIDLTQHRMVSYWNCYYRGRWPKTLRLDPNYTDYPGYRLMKLIRALEAPDQ